MLRFPEAPPLEPLIWPKSELLTLLLGLPYCGVLVTLNASARSSKMTRSVKAKERKTEASRLKNPGPLKAFCPVLP